MSCSPGHVKGGPRRKEPKPLPEPVGRTIQREAADKILAKPGLIAEIVKEVHKRGAIGEIKSIVVLAVQIIGGRLVENAKETSYHLLVSSETGTGKDWLVKCAVGMLPYDIFIHRTRISEKALNYWHNSALEPEWTWDGKILYLEDVGAEILNSEVLKVMLSGGSTATIVDKGRSVDLEIKGTPVVVLTTAENAPNNEGLRRLPILNLDESEKLTKEILKRQAEEAVKGESYDSKQLGRLLRDLKRVKVKVPFADELSETFPTPLMARTVFPRFLDIIKASAALHQRQRHKSKDGFVEATLQDYGYAVLCLRATTSGSTLLPLTHRQRLILKKFEELQLNGEGLTHQEIFKHIPIFTSDKRERREIDKLASMGTLSRSPREVEKGRPPWEFSLIHQQNLELKKPSEIKSSLLGKKGKKEIKGKKGKNTKNNKRSPNDFLPEDLSNNTELEGNSGFNPIYPFFSQKSVRGGLDKLPTQFEINKFVISTVKQGGVFPENLVSKLCIEFGFERPESIEIVDWYLEKGNLIKKDDGELLLGRAA